MEVELGLTFAKLNGSQAEIAARYALFEYNGFPAWFSKLAEVHPGVVQGPLADAITAEFDSEPSFVFGNVPHAELILQKLSGPILEQLLRDRQPTNLQSLGHALSILANVMGPRSIAEVAKERVLTVGIDQTRQIEWLTAWFKADPRGLWTSSKRSDPRKLPQPWLNWTLSLAPTGCCPTNPKFTLGFFSLRF